MLVRVAPLSPSFPLVNVWGKRFKLPQLTHESFLTIYHSAKLIFHRPLVCSTVREIQYYTPEVDGSSVWQISKKCFAGVIYGQKSLMCQLCSLKRFPPKFVTFNILYFQHIVQNQSIFYQKFLNYSTKVSIDSCYCNSRLQKPRFYKKNAVLNTKKDKLFAFKSAVFKNESIAWSPATGRPRFTLSLLFSSSQLMLPKSDKIQEALARCYLTANT